MTSIGFQSGLDDLRREVQRWVVAGLISPEQGERILQVEGASASNAVPAPAASSRRLSLVAELVSYLGIVLVFASGALFVSRIWHSLGFAGRISVGVVMALFGFVAGRAVMRLGEDGATRLGLFMWLVGTGGVGMSSIILMNQLTGQLSGWSLFVTGCVVAGVSLGLWRNLERPLQFASSIVGVGLMTGGFVTAMEWRVSPVVGGLLVWAVASLIGVFGALAVVHPAIEAVLSAQGGAFLGALMVTGTSRDLGLTLGLAGAVAGAAYGLSSKTMPVTGLGVVAFFIMLIRLLSYYMRGPGGLLTAFVIGVVLVGAVIWRATRGRPAGPSGEPASSRRHHLHFGH